MATEAAVQGLGIALGRKPLVNAELESSALEPVADIECAAENSYWLVGAAVTFERPEVKVFKNWILEEVQLLQQKTGLVDC
jgi:LysR family transcriptional regulator, glycine cleavage system transcriptional activator